MSLKKVFNKHVLYFSSVGIIISASFTLNLIPQKQVFVTKDYSIDNVSLSKIPLLKDVNSYPLLTAQGVYAFDVDSSVVLYQKNPDEKLLPASTTKMVTALVALDSYNLADVLNTGRFKTTGSQMGLVWNENITVEDLLYGLLVQSGNDAAEVLAINYPDGRDAFIKKMNEKAISLSAKNTNFANPAGLDNGEQYSTARDLSRIAQFAMNNEVFSKIVATETRLTQNIEGTIFHKVENRNELLGKVNGVLGVKTGWTENARENLVTFVERDNRRVIISLLGSQDRFGETQELIEWIFNNYEWREVNFNN